MEDYHFTVSPSNIEAYLYNSLVVALCLLGQGQKPWVLWVSLPNSKKEGAGCSTPGLSPSLTVDTVGAQYEGIKGSGSWVRKEWRLIVFHGPSPTQGTVAKREHLQVDGGAQGIRGPFSFCSKKTQRSLKSQHFQNLETKRLKKQTIGMTRQL